MYSLQHLCAIPLRTRLLVSKKQENTNANIAVNNVIQQACETNAGPLSKTTYKAVASALVKTLQNHFVVAHVDFNISGITKIQTC